MLLCFLLRISVSEHDETNSDMSTTIPNTVTDITPDDMIMREAVLGDHDEILSITQDENLYGGRDYLPHVLQDWLEDGIQQNSNRRNLVFLLKSNNNQIVGFRSIYLQNGRSVASFFARRIRKDIRGKGLGRRLSELTIEYLELNFPLVAHSLAVLGNHDIPDKVYEDSKHGMKLTERSCKTYQLKVDDKTLDNLAGYVSTDFKKTGSDAAGNCYKFITKGEYKQVLGNKHFISVALENDVIVLNWVPVLIKTEENFDFAAMNSQYVLVEGSVQNPIALSIFTCPVPCIDGKLRATLDYFTINMEPEKKTSVVGHLAKHLIHYCKEYSTPKAKKEEDEKKNEDDDNEDDGKNRKIDLEIFPRHVEDFEEIEDNLQKAGVDYKHIIHGWMKRDAPLNGVMLKEIA